MSSYVESRLPARTFTDREQQLLLRITGDHARGLRDHVLFALALGTGLREHELVALDLGDVFDREGRAKRRVQLRVFKKSNPDPTTQETVLSDRVRLKLEQLWKVRAQQGQTLDPAAPLFVSRERGRLSTRRVRSLFEEWQRRARFERILPFHCLRHTACTNLYRNTKDIRLTQRFARHKSLASTTRYTHASDEELVAAVGALRC
jgi:integrase/recombinase XerC